MPDDTLHIVEPAAMTDPLIVEAPPGHRPSKWTQVLIAVARDHPSPESVRVATLTTENSADVLASLLRHHKRGAIRPEGRWEFGSGLILEGADAGKFGVWATFTPPEP